MNRLSIVVLAALVAAVAPSARAAQQSQSVPLAPANQPGTDANGHPLQSVGKVGGRTYRWANGWAWMSLGDDAKVSMVVGIEQGIVFSVRENWKALPKNDQQTLVNTAERLTVGGVSFNQVVFDMDKLYLDPENDLIPVVDGYLYVVLQLQKAPKDQIKKFLDGLRTTYKSPPIVMQPMKIKVKGSPKP